MADATNSTSLSALPAPAIARERVTLPAGRRRLFALAAGAAAALTAPTAIAATSPVVAPVIHENPDLLALGDQLESLLNAFRTALARKMEARASYEKLRPALPDDLVRRSPTTHSRARITEEDTDVDGNHLWEPVPGVKGQEGPRWIYRYRLVQSDIILREIPRHTKEGKQLRRIAD